MKIKPGAKVIADQRLTIIKVISELAADNLKSHKSDVKSRMESKGATFAESDLVSARVQGGGKKTAIDPKNFFALVKAGKIKQSEFEACISVRKEPAAKLLSERELDAISVNAGDADVSLITEFKDGISINLPRIEAAILHEIRSQLSKAAA
jgi:hypothetical protein